MASSWTPTVTTSSARTNEAVAPNNWRGLRCLDADEMFQSGPGGAGIALLPLPLRAPFTTLEEQLRDTMNDGRRNEAMGAGSAQLRAITLLASDIKAHIVATAQRALTLSLLDDATLEVCIGSTVVHALPHRQFSTGDMSSWSFSNVVAGPASRWRATFQPAGFDGMVVVAVVSNEDAASVLTTDVSHELVPHEAQQASAAYTLATLLEQSVAAAFDDAPQTAVHPRVRRVKLDALGGDYERLCATEPAHCIYFAYRFVPQGRATTLSAGLPSLQLPRRSWESRWGVWDTTVTPGRTMRPRLPTAQTLSSSSSPPSSELVHLDEGIGSLSLDAEDADAPPKAVAASEGGSQIRQDADTDEVADAIASVETAERMLQAAKERLRLATQLRGVQ